MDAGALRRERGPAARIRTPDPISIVSFHAFVEALDAALRAAVSNAETIVLEEQPAKAAWTHDPFRAGVERVDLSVRAWGGLEGFVAREFSEPLTCAKAWRRIRDAPHGARVNSGITAGRASGIAPASPGKTTNGRRPRDRAGL